MRYIHLAEAWLNQPVMFTREKLDILVAAIGARLGLDAEPGVLPLSLSPTSEDDNKLYSVNMANGIATMPIRGSLVKRGDMMQALSGLTSYEQIKSNLEKLAEDPTVKAILLAIDSHGGEVAGNFETAEQISSLAQTKPVWAVADSFAYSAAYSLASAAEKLYVPRVGGVGSIGVLAVHVDRSEYFKNSGIKHTIIKSGDRKADAHPYGPLSSSARAGLQERLDGIRAVCVEHVARNRRISADAVYATEGGVYLGADAIDL